MRPANELRLAQTRRSFLTYSGAGLGYAALASMLGAEKASAAERDKAWPAAVKPLHVPPKAKRVIHLYMAGGPSHLETLDHKPKLAERHGKPLGEGEKPDVFFGKVGLLRKNDWDFKQRGQSG